jgi:hypothetical protein
VLLDLLRFEVHQPRELGDAMVLQQTQVIADEDFGGCAGEPEMAQLQQQTLLQVARADANRIERLHVFQRALDERDVPRAQCRNFIERRDQVAVLVDVADNRRADVTHRVVSRLKIQVELPGEVIGQRAL